MKMTYNARKHILASLLILIILSTPLYLFSDQETLAATTAGVTERVSVASNGAEGNYVSGYYGSSSLSGNGRIVAYSSGASNLVDGDTNGFEDIFIHDRLSGETTRVSVASDGIQGNSSSVFSSISADGRYVAFISQASNLVEGDTNSSYDVFVHDRVTGETTRVSVASDGTQGNSAYTPPSISGDGHYVAFESNANNLVEGDTNSSFDIFVHDRVTGDTTRVSVASDGTQGNSYSHNPSISADGRYVAFISLATNLVAGDTNSSNDVFVHDRVTGETTRASVASEGTQGNWKSVSPSISANGRFVAFISLATNLVAGDTNEHWDIFVHDRVTGETTRVSVASDGTQANSSSGRPSISMDGRYVVFESTATNLIIGDTNGFVDVFVHDRENGETVRISVATDGSQANDFSWLPSISTDGRYSVFASAANNLVDGDTNEYYDVFVHDQGSGTLPTRFLDLPVRYTNFEEAALANTGASDSEARVNGWFDHTNPGWGNADGNLTRWNGTLGTPPIGVSNCQHPSGNFNNCYDAHDGVDIRSFNYDYDILAAGDGQAVYVINDWPTHNCEGLGNCVKIDHQNCYMSIYGHLSSVNSLLLSASPTNPLPVTRGQIIGVMGNTGSYRMGTHLHFSVFKDPVCDGDWTDKVQVDPYGWSGEGIDPLKENSGSDIRDVRTGALIVGYL
jgi:Tol biopolymer transport system component